MLVCTTLSIENYRDMDQGLGQQISRKTHPDNFAQKTKEKFRNHDDFGTFWFQMFSAHRMFNLELTHSGIKKYDYGNP